ncbi:unnamed protein product [Phytophthora lilii]|uniref:Unnamed protein product n=1 Tax=Phytophthora lilii TaxID=2077276 RepID=A0A9W6TZ04_9STRA|nr:unnamed protein product [Phytophthora lilii]
MDVLADFLESEPLWSDIDSTELETVDEKRLLQDTDALLASTSTRKKIPLTGAQRRHRYHLRKKSERACLEQQFVKLSQQLRSLRRKIGSRHSITQSTWKMTANREKQTRVSAEMQHKQLQTAVAGQAVLIVELNRILNQASGA